MIDDRYNPELERELVDTLEQISDFEGIFLELRDRKDADKLVGLYEHYIGLTGEHNFKSVMYKKRIDYIEKYYTKINGEQMRFLGNLNKKWNTPILD
jgi:hypothetical protein